MSYIELKNVGKHYNMGEITIAAAADVNFIIEKGELAVITGPSGAGKTTILNILCGMDTCDQREVFLDGKMISRFNPRQLTTYRREDVG